MTAKKDPAVVGATRGVGIEVEDSTDSDTTGARATQDLAVIWIRRRYGLRDALARIVAVEAGIGQGAA